MREGMRDSELVGLAALIRGGASWEEAITWPEVGDVSPVTLAAWREHIEAEATKPGPERHIPRPITPEEERRRLEVWLGADRERITVKLAGGGVRERD